VKRMWWIGILLILAVGLLTALFMGRSTDDPRTHGGVITDKTDPNAAKIISSTEILSFDCSFSTSNLPESESLHRGYYSFTAAVADGMVEGSYYCAANAQGSPERASFKADTSFMKELQSIVAEYDLAKYNGLSYSVSGLPSRLGVSLTITYASGEQISARNNQTNLLAMSEMTALEELFYRTAFGKSGVEHDKKG